MDFKDFEFLLATVIDVLFMAFFIGFALLPLLVAYRLWLNLGRLDDTRIFLSMALLVVLMSSSFGHSGLMMLLRLWRMILHMSLRLWGRLRGRLGGK